MTQKTQAKSTIFVIQKHDARNLHYDFRLKVGKVLVSWVVPKGVTLSANEKHLAIRTKDHPLKHADFEGVIPEGEYGAGPVMVWDKGTYEILSKSKSMKEALEEGKLKVTLKGEKLKGAYAMTRLRVKDGQEEWLIFKVKDKEADQKNTVLKSKPKSVLTGRSLKEIAEEEKSEK